MQSLIPGKQVGGDFLPMSTHWINICNLTKNLELPMIIQVYYQQLSTDTLDKIRQVDNIK